MSRLFSSPLLSHGHHFHGQSRSCSSFWQQTDDRDRLLLRDGGGGGAAEWPMRMRDWDDETCSRSAISLPVVVVTGTGLLSSWLVGEGKTFKKTTLILSFVVFGSWHRESSFMNPDTSYPFSCINMLPSLLGGNCLTQCGREADFPSHQRTALAPSFLLQSLASSDKYRGTASFLHEFRQSAE